MANSEGKGAGRTDQGQDINLTNSESEAAGRIDQSHDNFVANSKGEGAGRSDQGQDIVGGECIKGGRRRAVSDPSSSTSSSRGMTSVRDTVVRRRGQSGQ